MCRSWAARTQFVSTQTGCCCTWRAEPDLRRPREQPRVVLSVAVTGPSSPPRGRPSNGEDPALGIPTTYYAAVQIVGTATVFERPDGHRRGAAGAAGCPPARGHHCRPRDGPPAAAARHPGHHRGRRGGPGEVQKYGGNVDAAHRAAVVERLRERGAPGDLAAAAHTERRSSGNGLGRVGATGVPGAGQPGRRDCT